MRLISIEWKRWLRSKNLFLLVFLFLFSGLTSPLLSYYSNDIIKSMVSDGQTPLILPSPTWQSLFISYFKNTAQLSLFVSIFLVCKMVTIRSTDALHHFYMTRTKSLLRLFVPKILVSCSVVSLASLCGQLMCSYMSWVFFDTIKWQHVIISFILQWFAIMVIILVATCLIQYLNSAFLVALIIEVLLFVSTIASQFSWEKYLPSQLLYQTKLIDKTISLNDIPSLLSCLLLILLFMLGFALLKKFPRLL